MYGADDVIVTASTSFFVFPVLMSVITIGGVLLLVVAITGRHRIGEAVRVLAGK